MTISANNATNNAIDLKALLYALTQQREPLPQPIQNSLQEAGQALQQNQPDAAYQLRERLKSYSPLDAAYRSALQDFDRQYASQQRTKSLGVAFPNGAGLDWLFINDVIPASDWVFTAKQILQAQQSESPRDQLWARINRIALMTLGGISIGAAIAQLPGAIVLGIIATLSGWYYEFPRKPAPNSSARNI